ncbi:MAG: nucleoside monophosphate kinase, partial [Fimbriimonadaceae bacterium]
MRLILIGPPGVGKGTQAALIEERLGVRTLSSGVIFRAEIEAETDLGQLAKSYIDRGELVPNGVT